MPSIFSCGDYDLDNNLIERMQRLVSLLRRTALFFGTLSGHSEGSRAFARYRDIDEDMKKKLVSLLDR